MVRRQWEISFILDGSLDWTVCFERQIPQTFFLVLKKNITVDEAWDDLHKGERFFKRDLFEQERVSAMELWQIFKRVSLNENKADQLMWEVDSKGKCTVKKVVFSLDCEVLWRIKRCGFLSFGSYAFQQRCNASYGCYSKMAYLQNAFLRDRGIPTVNGRVNCSWCNEAEENCDKFFLSFFLLESLGTVFSMVGVKKGLGDGVGRLLGLIYGPLEWMGLFATECKAVRRQKLVIGLPTDDMV
ncbi:hypothetical protein ERO13_D06G181950v2 [Gossypium hirsutum]|uniref:Uncharacterized protein n=2 Tax=Gossypium TaxID=3633 RepID=A0A5D2ULF1_GOSMU|nr:hypothetical protein ERO13_D06G181950v2 [Gossypium hirsutum]TYH68071.1 hypothetical protein ES332_D06G232800v1 [Gossypium tomentosum]TYI78517.1 hypothetical protein E1A91_D06G217900v1 [Gossypium mustelinum]